MLALSVPGVGFITYSSVPKAWGLGFGAQDHGIRMDLAASSSW